MPTHKFIVEYLDKLHCDHYSDEAVYTLDISSTRWSAQCENYPNYPNQGKKYGNTRELLMNFMDWPLGEKLVCLQRHGQGVPQSLLCLLQQSHDQKQFEKHSEGQCRHMKNDEGSTRIHSEGGECVALGRRRGIVNHFFALPDFEYV